MAEWTGIANTTITKYLREVEDNVLRNRKLLALMKKKGRISMNESGKNLEWRIRYKRHAMQGFADGDTLTFARNDLWKVASLDWRGYASGDSMTKKEKLINKGAEAIVKRYSEIIPTLVDDIQENFSDQLYVDGNATGNEKFIHGIESFMGVNGTSAVVGTPVMQPLDTYAGLDTTLGAYGGSWSSTWPNHGTGPAEYDFWSPLILDITSSLAVGSGGWSSATATWAARCQEIMRFGIIHSKKNKTLQGQNDLITLDAEFYRLFEEFQAAKERIVINRGDRKDGLLSIGFTDVINFEGSEVTYEYGAPANTAYGWNTEKMMLNSLQDQLFVPMGPDYNPGAQGWVFSVDFYGNLWFNPRYFWKAAAYGSNGA